LAGFIRYADADRRVMMGKTVTQGAIFDVVRVN